MAKVDGTFTQRGPVWVRNITLPLAGAGAVLLVIDCYMLLSSKPTWMSLSLAVATPFVLGTAYASNTRHQPGRLLGYGRKYVQVRSLDEWTLYQYELPFEASSPEQQNEALKRYRVGLRLFPARPQDIAPKQSSWQWLLALLMLFAFMTLSEAVHGWYWFFVLLAYFAWMWGCLRISRRFMDTPAASNLTELDLR